MFDYTLAVGNVFDRFTLFFITYCNVYNCVCTGGGRRAAVALSAYVEAAIMFICSRC